MELESCKMLGKLNGVGILPADIQVSAHCNRVPVEDGHTESVSIKLKKPASREEILGALHEFRGIPQELRLPNAPPSPIVLLDQPDRPQPTLDVDMSAGMAVPPGPPPPRPPPPST